MAEGPLLEWKGEKEKVRKTGKLSFQFPHSAVQNGSYKKASIERGKAKIKKLERENLSFQLTHYAVQKG